MQFRIKYFIVLFSFLILGKLYAQNDSIKIKSYEISDQYFVNYLGFIKPALAVVPTNGGLFSPNWQLWYLKTQDSILSIEPSYLDTTLVITRTSKHVFEIIKMYTDTTSKKIMPLVLTRGLVFYAVPSNYTKGLSFYVVWCNNRYNICQHYNNKVDTLFHSDKMIDQLEVISKSAILFSYDNQIIIYPLTGKPSVLFDADKNKIYGFTSDNEGGLFVSIDKGILRIDKEKYQSLISTDSIKGKLRYFNKELYVLDADNKKLQVIHIPSLEDLSYSGKVTLTNDSIVKMVLEKFTDEQIIQKINSSKANFDLSVNAMIALSKQNVSSDVMIVMDNRSKKFKH